MQRHVFQHRDGKVATFPVAKYEHPAQTNFAETAPCDDDQSGLDAFSFQSNRPADWSGFQLPVPRAWR